MPHQQVRRLAAARPKPSGIASVSEISYRRVLRAGSKQEILRADFKKVRIPNKREWIAPGESKPVPRGATNHRQGTLLLVGGLARGQGALHQDLHRVAMKNYQKSNVNNRRPGPTVGGQSEIVGFDRDLGAPTLEVSSSIRCENNGDECDGLLTGSVR